MQTVEAPTIALAVGGLLPLANVIETSDPLTQQLGVTYQRAPYTVPQPIPTSPTPKTFESQYEVSGEPFAIYKGIQTSAFQRALAAGLVDSLFGAGEGYAVEVAVQENLLNPLAVDLTPTAGTAVTPKQALAILEQWAADNYLGLPLLHTNRFGTVLLDDMVSGDLPLHTRQSTPLANGGGYGATGPALDAPILSLGTTHASGGSFVADDYFWVVTAITGVEESVVSNEVTAAIALNGRQVLNWIKVPGATGYRVYRGTATTVWGRLVATLGDVATYTDTGIAGTAQAPANVASPRVAANDEAWLYISGQVNLWRGPVVKGGADVYTSGARRELIERIYVPTCDGPVAAILMSL